MGYFLVFVGLVAVTVGGVSLFSPLRRLRIKTRDQAFGILIGGVFLFFIGAPLIAASLSSSPVSPPHRASIPPAPGPKVARLQDECANESVIADVDSEQTAQEVARALQKRVSEEYRQYGQAALTKAVFNPRAKKWEVVTCLATQQAAGSASPPQPPSLKRARLLEFRIAKATARQSFDTRIYEFEGVVTNAGSELILSPTITIEIYSKEAVLLDQEQRTPVGQFMSQMKPGTSSGIHFFMEPRGGESYCLLMFANDAQLRLTWIVGSSLPLCPPYYRKQ